MSPTVLPTAPRRPGLRGGHVLGIFLGFFAAVFVVNGAMIYSAVTTHSGLVANEPYRKGLHYNERIAADRRQASLGWTETLEVGRDGSVRLALTEGEDYRCARPPFHQPARHRADARRSLAGKIRGAHFAAGGRQLAALARGPLIRSRGPHLPHAEARMAQALSRLPLGSRDDVDSRHVQCVTTTLAVEGMHCGGCMRKVELALAAVPGVISARANLSARRVAAVHRATGVTGIDLIEALDRIGF